MPQPNVPGVDPQLQALCDGFRHDYRAIQAEIGNATVGHEDIVDGVLPCLVVGGHALLEGVPGLGKTALIRSLAQALNLKFARIQFTPDLMPADVIGTNVIMENQAGHRAFQFMHGPIFAQIVLADEINRATPKTQSALLEAMQEKQVTAGGEVRPLVEPFFVMATQNPLEQEGTYPLPEAQLDRFFFKLVVNYSTRDELAVVLDRTTKNEFPQPDRVMDGPTIMRWQQFIRKVLIAPPVQVRFTHPTQQSSTSHARRHYAAAARLALPCQAGAARTRLPQDLPRPDEGRAAQQAQGAERRVRRLPQLRQGRRPPLPRLE